MAADKQLARMEAKLDALLEDRGLKPADYETMPRTQGQERTLTPQEQEAIDNAPKTPVGANGPAEDAPRTSAQNAPATPAADDGKGNDKTKAKK